MKTDRRNFIKSITGFVAGVCAAFVPKAKGDKPFVTVRTVSNENPDPVIKIGKPSNMRPVTKEHPSCYGFYETAGCTPCATVCEFTKECASSPKSKKAHKFNCEVFATQNPKGKAELEAQIDESKYRDGCEKFRYVQTECGSHIVCSLEYVKGTQEVALYIDGKKAKKDKDGRYSYYQSQ